MHEYPVIVDWKGGRTGEGAVRTDRTSVENALRVPPEFGGNSEMGTNPEELLTSDCGLLHDHVWHHRGQPQVAGNERGNERGG